ncbi:MAG: ABC transporter substrate-binding protein [Nitrospirota bacterium]|nr:MAG: ABC transporter substrate-binding protein [Nitrospirota bacterium]
MMKLVSTLGWVMLSCILFIGSAAANEPSEVVKRLQSSLVEVMKDGETLGYQGRYEKLEPVVVDCHDIPYVARLSVGKYWKTFDDQQRSRLVKTFRQLSIATYADRFDGYSGEQFTLISEKELPRGKMLVETKFTKSDGQQLQFNYLLRKTRDRWKIVNISVDGVSDLALKRAEYMSLVKNEGYPALLNKMETQIRRYANGKK